MYLYMEIHVHSTVARKQKENKDKVTHPTIAQRNKCTVHRAIYNIMYTFIHIPIIILLVYTCTLCIVFKGANIQGMFPY